MVKYEEQIPENTKAADTKVTNIYMYTVFIIVCVADNGKISAQLSSLIIHSFCDSNCSRFWDRVSMKVTHV